MRPSSSSSGTRVWSQAGRRSGALGRAGPRCPADGDDLQPEVRQRQSAQRLAHTPAAHAEVILDVAPDVFGTQEGLYEKLKDMAADLPDYDWIGLGRNGGSRDEFSAAFYRRRGLNPWRSITSGSPTRPTSRRRTRGARNTAAW